MDCEDVIGASGDGGVEGTVIIFSSCREAKGFLCSGEGCEVGILL